MSIKNPIWVNVKKDIPTGNQTELFVGIIVFEVIREIRGAKSNVKYLVEAKNIKFATTPNFIKIWDFLLNIKFPKSQLRIIEDINIGSERISQNK